MTGKRQPRRKSSAKRGRPPLPADQRKRAPLGFRPTPQTRQALEQAAEESGRSLSEEIEFQIQRAFAKEETNERLREEIVNGVREKFGGMRLYEDIQFLAVGLRMVETYRGENWNASQEAVAQTQGLVARVLEWVAHTNAPTDLDSAETQAAEAFGAALGEEMIKQIDEIAEKRHPWLKKARETMAKDKAKQTKSSSKGD